jgi:hypothetical protein
MRSHFFNKNNPSFTFKARQNANYGLQHIIYAPNNSLSVKCKSAGLK